MSCNKATWCCIHSSWLQTESTLELSGGTTLVDQHRQGSPVDGPKSGVSGLRTGSPQASPKKCLIAPLTRHKLGAAKTGPDQKRSRFDYCARNRFGSNIVLIRLRSFWPKFGQISHTFDRNWPTGPSWGRTRPESSQTRPALAKVGRNLAIFGSI